MELARTRSRPFTNFTALMCKSVAVFYASKQNIYLTAFNLGRTVCVCVSMFVRALLFKTLTSKISMKIWCAFSDMRV
jgi:hypothetical protein